MLQEAEVRYHRGSLQQLETGYELARRVLPQDNLIYFLRGRADWVWDRTPVRLEPDRWTLVPRGTPHEAHGLTQRITLMSYHVEMTLPGGRDVLRMLSMPMGVQVAADSRLAQMVRLSMREYERPSQSTTHAMLTHWAKLILPELLRETAAQGKLLIQDISETVADVVRWMHQHLDQPTSLDGLEEISGYSAQHLNRMFHESLGVTAMQYLMRIRMQHAARLLREGRLSIAGVGRAVGFDSQFYFSRVFRKYFDASPRRWRETQCSDNPSSR